MAFLRDILGTAIQKPQSWLTGGSIGLLRDLGLADPNSQWHPEIQGIASGLKSGTTDKLHPRDLVNDMVGDATPGLLQRSIGTVMDTGYDPLMLAGGVAKLGGLGTKAAAAADIAGGAKVGKYVEDASKLQKIAAGAGRAATRGYAGTLAEENNDPLMGLALGNVGAGVGKGISKLAPAAGSKVSNYLQGKAAGKALASEGDAIAPETVAAISRKLASADTTPFNVPTQYRMGDELVDLPGMDINPGAGGMQPTQPWKPQAAPSQTGEGLFDPSMLDQPGMFDPAALAPGKMAPGNTGAQGRLEFPGSVPTQQTPFNAGTSMQPELGPVGNSVSPRNTGEMSFGSPQTDELGALEAMFQAPSAQPQASQGQLFGPETLPRGNMAPMQPEVSRQMLSQAGQPPAQPTIPPFMRQGSSEFMAPQSQGPPFQGQLPQQVQQGAQRQLGAASTAAPSQAAPASTSQTGIPTGPSGFQANLPETASGGQIVQLIQEAMAQGIPYNEVMRVILKHQFPGRI